LANFLGFLELQKILMELRSCLRSKVSFSFLLLQVFLEYEQKRRTRKELNRVIDLDYYGFYDEDDERLLQAERAAEEKR
jgi:uncharacterized protein YjiS (DUF1127 family)